MTGVEFRRRLRAGDPLFGTLLVSPSPVWPRVLAECPLDFVFIDTEHIALNRESVSWMCRCYSAMGLPPLVRVTRPDADEVTLAFDDGAAGVIAPYVETAANTRELVGAARLRPLKGRLREEALAGRTLGNPLSDYIEARTAGNALIVNIESGPALENLDAILDIEGLDAVLIGPHDLSCSLGRPEEYGHPEFLRAAETILGQARAHGIGAGIHYWGSIEEQIRFAEMGANLLIHKADTIYLREGLCRDLDNLRKAIGNETKPENTP